MKYNPQEFYDLMFADCEGYVEIRELPSGIQHWVSYKDVCKKVSDLSGDDSDIYHGCGTREDGKGGKDGVIEIPCLWTDIDFKDSSEEEAKEILKNFPLKPTAEIFSGGGIHSYWKLREPFKINSINDRDVIESYLKKLTSSLKGDNTSAELARILRVPGTRNFKKDYDTPPDVYISNLNGEEYSLEGFDFLPDVESQQGSYPNTNGTESGSKDEIIRKIKETLTFYDLLPYLEEKEEQKISCPNPAHEDTNPSFSIYENGTKGNCFSGTYPDCKHHDVISFYRLLYNCDFDTAKRSLAIMAGIQIPQHKTISTVEWSDPIPLDDNSDLPEFPTDALPITLREIVEAVAEVNQVDTSLPACIALSVLSTCLAKKAKVELSSHEEPLNIFTCPVLGSGERKSRTMKIMSRPIMDYQKKKQKKMEDKIRQVTLRNGIDEDRIAVKRKKAANTDDKAKSNKLAKEAEAISNFIRKHPIPKLPQYIVDDITSEKLGEVMTENNERIGMISAEGGIFGIMSGLYSDKGSNIDIYLKGHAGDQWSSDRISRERKSMDSPALTVCLAVQPDVINVIGSNRRFRGRGLLARFLYSLCISKVGYRKLQTKAVPDKIIKKYEDFIFKLMDISIEDRLLKLTPEANKLWGDFYHKVESSMRPDEQLDFLKDWGSKLAGAVGRIAGLLHFAEHGKKAIGKDISTGITGDSIAIGNYFFEFALAAFGLMKEDSRIESAKKILEYLIEHQPDQFKGNEVLNMKNYFKQKTMDEVNSGLELLIERGYIRRKETSKTNSVGRPWVQIYEVNPKINKQ